jgi:hypothetical protein
LSIFLTRNRPRIKLRASIWCLLAKERQVDSRTQELMMKYDRMDAPDASLVILSGIHRNAKIITTDHRDCSIYRRFGRHRLPVIPPPA